MSYTVMNNKEMTIGQPVRKARKGKGYNQTELAKALDTTTTYLLGYKTETVKPQITTFADVAATLFELEKISGLKFDIDVKRPPRDDNWEYAIKFDGKAKTDLNADMCLFLEDWAAARDFSPEQYEDWKDKTLVYYSRLTVAEQANEADNNAIKVKIAPVEDLGNYDYKE